MDGSRWWAAGAIAFGVLFGVAATLVGDPGNTASELADKADQLLVAFVLSVLASLGAIAFFAGCGSTAARWRTVRRCC